MNLGEAFPRLFKDARPLLSEYERDVIAGSLLATHRIEALRIRESPCRMVVGYSILRELLNSKPDEFYGLLWRSCGPKAMPLPSLSAEEPFESLLASFARTGFGHACIHNNALESIVSLSDALELYRKNLISSSLRVGDVASTIVRLPRDVTVGDVIRTMFAFKIRRIFIEGYAFVSDRRLINFLFSPAELEEVRDRPTEVMSHPISEVGPIEAKEVTQGTYLTEASAELNPRDGGCLVFEDKVVTPWDLLMKRNDLLTKSWKVGKPA